MKQEVCALDIPGTGAVSVVVERKKISSCRLKIFPSRTIKLSVPYDVSSSWIDRYLHGKKTWIKEKLEKFAKTEGYDASGTIRNGMSVRVLGEDMLFSINKSEKRQVHAEYRSIYISLPDPSAARDSERLFESWWRKQALLVYNEVLDSLYPVIEKHKIKKPKVLIRKMKTLWGSSSPHKGSITINFYLLKARRPCIEYVILHELTHFIYPHHNQQFFDFLTLYMPDWKDIKIFLDTDVVQGL